MNVVAGGVRVRAGAAKLELVGMQEAMMAAEIRAAQNVFITRSPRRANNRWKA